MDEKDLEAAAILEQMERDSAIERARKAVQTKPPSDFDGSCLECGAEVHPDRVAAGYYVCIDCAEEKELLKKQFWEQR